MTFKFAVSEFDKARYMGLCLRYNKPKAGVKIEENYHFHIGRSNIDVTG